MKVFISGGCKNGKSFHAQTIAKKLQPTGGSLYYLATMIPKDTEDESRIARHREDREGWGFETIELADSLTAGLRDCNPRGSFLLDSVTALLENAMFPPDGGFYPEAWKRLARELAEATEHLQNVVFVSDFIYSDACFFEDLTDQYRQCLAALDRQLAARCDVVLEACYGNLLIYKGTELFEPFYYTRRYCNDTNYRRSLSR